MFNSIEIIIPIFLYIGILYFIARWSAENKTGKKFASSPFVYAFSLAIYCTSWTFYGSIGSYSRDGWYFIFLYLGPVLAYIFFDSIITRIIRLKSEFKITSIADFISTRYRKSYAVGVVVTVVILIGLIPYIALQLKSVITTFNYIAGLENPTELDTLIGPITVIMMIGFTIVFGVRRVDPTERHPGMISAVAIESVLKLAVFLFAGIFISFFLFDGIGDILSGIPENYSNIVAFDMELDSGKVMILIRNIIISMSAVLFLPRMFHVSVVESTGVEQFKKAKWIFIAYLIVINIFVAPIAWAGLASGLQPENGDFFILNLPLASNSKYIALLVFLGGFSAATSMIMITTMTLSTMVTNHLLAPVIKNVPALNYLRKKILRIRWITVAILIFASYLFVLEINRTYSLINIGVLSFVAILQLVPAAIGAVVWIRGNRVGALLGLISGFAVWVYKLLVPILLSAVSTDHPILSEGLFGISFLSPENLLGLNMFDHVTNTVLLSLLINLTLYIAGSLLVSQDDEEKEIAHKFRFRILFPLHLVDSLNINLNIDMQGKTQKILTLFKNYFSENISQRQLDLCLANTGINSKSKISIIELANLRSETEKVIAGVVGTAVANKELNEAEIISESEKDELKSIYASLLTKMNISPSEIINKIDYYKEREKLLSEHQKELEAKIAEREAEIEERKLVEEKLRVAENKYRGIYENSIEGIFQSTRKGEIVNANPAFASILRYDSVKDLLSSITNVKTQLYVDQSLRDELFRCIERDDEVKGFAVEIYRKDSSIIWCSISARAIRNSSGEAEMIEGTMVDISEKKRDEDKLRNLNRMLLEERNIFIRGDVVVFKWSNMPDWPVEYVSPNVTGVFGYGIDEFMSGTIKYLNLIYSEDKNRFMDEIGKSTRENLNHVDHEDYRVVTKDKKIIWLHHYTSIVKDDSGIITHFLGYTIDITDRKMAEDELKVAKEVAEKADMLKSEFLAQMSHEIRTPINTIMSFTSLLRMDPDHMTPKDKDDCFNMIESGAGRLLRTIDLVLNMSDIELGTYSAYFENKLLYNEILLPVYKEFRSYAHRKNLSLDIKMNTEKDVIVNVDTYTMIQIMANLVDNAIKYTKEGSIVIRVDSEGSDILVRVEDTGIGISKGYIPMLFNKFSQEEQGYTRRFEGNGLGLALVKKYCEINESEISVESEKGKGTKFTVRIKSEMIDEIPRSEL